MLNVIFLCCRMFFKLLRRFSFTLPARPGAGEVRIVSIRRTTGHVTVNAEFAPFKFRLTIAVSRNTKGPHGASRTWWNR